jgi:hypothetical protein
MDTFIPPNSKNSACQFLISNKKWPFFQCLFVKHRRRLYQLIGKPSTRNTCFHSCRLQKASNRWRHYKVQTRSPLQIFSTTYILQFTSSRPELICYVGLRLWTAQRRPTNTLHRCFT